MKLCRWKLLLNKTDRIIFDTDEHPRQTSLEKLSQLKPAFIKEGTVTAGNSSGINDGAAMLMLANESTVKKYNLKPMARVVSMAVAGVDPAIMGIGPVAATQKALQRAGITVSDLDLIEMNEAFASQSIACIHELGLDLGESKCKWRRYCHRPSFGLQRRKNFHYLII